MKCRQISSSGSFTSSDSDLVEHQLSRKRRGKYFKKEELKMLRLGVMENSSVSIQGHWEPLN